MKSIITKGIICVRDNLNIEYRLCEIEHILNDDETYKYIFTPNYFVIDLLDSSQFQGIPGINLDLRRDNYIRENMNPTFISERVPSEKREDYYELLESVNMEYMNPIEYLIRLKKRYSGDRLYVISYEEPKKIMIEDIEKKCNSLGIIKLIIDNIASGNTVILGDDINLSSLNVFKILYHIYEKSQKIQKYNQSQGIEAAKANGKYGGRKPKFVEEIKFRDMLNRVDNKELTAKEAAKNMGISIDKYYRMKKKMQN